MRRVCIVYLMLMTFSLSAEAGLVEYVKQKDNAFRWERISESDIAKDVRAVEIKLSSLVWKDIRWEHRLRLVIPSKIESNAPAFLHITGSGDGEEELLIAASIAKRTGCLVAILHDIPNQPLFDELVEDQLISFTFEKYLQTDDESWLLPLPMTKATVRAMDTIQEYTTSELHTEISGFVVGGASKRGWTTWLTAAVDKRVTGIIPAVYDNLDMPRQMRHQIESWGEYSEEIGDYTERGLPQIAHTETAKNLIALVDPYAYRERLSVPKLIMIGTNDPYWPLDALNIYYGDLPGEKHILYVPNAEHDIFFEQNEPLLGENVQRAVSGIVAFLQRATGKIAFPKLSWNFAEDDRRIKLTIDPKTKPKHIIVWTAKSKTRDFRQSLWVGSTLTSQNSIYLHTFNAPAKGYVAVFGEAVYGIGEEDLFLSTNVHITGTTSPAKKP